MPRKKAKIVWWVDSPDIRYAGTAAQAIEIIELEACRSLSIDEDIRTRLDDEFASDMRWVAGSRELAEEHLCGRGHPLFLYEGKLPSTAIVVTTDKTGWELVLAPGGKLKGAVIEYSRDYPRSMMSALCQDLVGDLEATEKK